MLGRFSVRLATVKLNKLFKQELLKVKIYKIRKCYNCEETLKDGKTMLDKNKKMYTHTQTDTQLLVLTCP